MFQYSDEIIADDPLSKPLLDENIYFENGIKYQSMPNILSDSNEIRKNNTFMLEPNETELIYVKEDVTLHPLGSPSTLPNGENATKPCNGEKQSGPCKGKKNNKSVKSKCHSLYFAFFLCFVIIIIILCIFIGYSGFLQWFSTIKKSGLIINGWFGFAIFILVKILSSYVGFRSCILCSGKARSISITLFVLQALFSIFWVATLFGFRNFKLAIVFAALYFITITIWMIYLLTVDTLGASLLILNFLWGAYILTATINLYRTNSCPNNTN